MSDEETKPGRPDRSTRRGLGLWFFVLLIATGIVHTIVVFLLPNIGRAVNMAEALPSEALAPKLYTALDLPGGDPFRFSDVTAETVTCSFDLRDGAVRVGSVIDAPVWYISVYTPTGQVAGAVSHNAAGGGSLEVIVMTPSLARSLAEAGTQFPPQALVVEFDGPIGIARASALVRYPAERQRLRAALADIDCETAVFTTIEQDPDDSGPDDDGGGADDGPIPLPVPRPDDLN